MNWKLIFLLSMLGPVMALAGIYGIVSFETEPYIVLGVLALFAITISMVARRRYFLHSLLTVILFGVFMSIVRLLLLSEYINHNPEVMEKTEDLLHKVHYIRSPMVVLGSMIMISAIITGLFSLIFSLLMKRK